MKKRGDSPKGNDFNRMAENIYRSNSWIKNQKDFELAFERYMEDSGLDDTTSIKFKRGAYNALVTQLSTRGVTLKSYKIVDEVNRVKETRKAKSNPYRFQGIIKTKDKVSPEKVVDAKKIYVTLPSGKKIQKFRDKRGRFVKIPKRISDK